MNFPQDSIIKGSKCYELLTYLTYSSIIKIFIKLRIQMQINYENEKIYIL